MSSFSIAGNDIRAMDTSVQKYHTSFDECECLGFKYRPQQDCKHIKYLWSTMTIEQRCGYYNTTRWRCNCAFIKYNPTKMCYHMAYLRDNVPGKPQVFAHRRRSPSASELPLPPAGWMKAFPLERGVEIHPPIALKRQDRIYPGTYMD
jgi:hypothetical protein